MFFHYSHKETEEWKEVDLGKRRTPATLGAISQSALYDRLQPVASLKKKDLLSLLPLIPPCDHEFFSSISLLEIKCRVLLIVNGQVIRVKTWQLLNLLQRISSRCTVLQHTPLTNSSLLTVVFKSLNNFYDEVVTVWMRAHSGRSETVFQIQNYLVKHMAGPQLLQQQQMHSRTVAYDPGAQMFLKITNFQDSKLQTGHTQIRRHQRVFSCNSIHQSQRNHRPVLSINSNHCCQRNHQPVLTINSKHHSFIYSNTPMNWFILRAGQESSPEAEFLAKLAKLMGKQQMQGLSSEHGGLAFQGNIRALY